MDAIPCTVTPRGTDQPITINGSALLACFAQVPDQRTRRGVRYPLAILLTIAVLARRCGSSQVSAIADWAHERRTERYAALQRNRAKMPHPTTWTPSAWASRPTRLMPPCNRCSCRLHPLMCQHAPAGRWRLMERPCAARHASCGRVPRRSSGQCV